MRCDLAWTVVWIGFSDSAFWSPPPHPDGDWSRVESICTVIPAAISLRISASPRPPTGGTWPRARLGSAARS
eukprot:7384491-Prymnesium_polylepis.1